MYECIYGGTPFVCETRDETKKRIVRHRKTLKFPLMPSHLQPSMEALDLMMHLLVRKEDRLCTRRYQLNDWTRRMFGNVSRQVELDKQHCNYAGYFVYADDAEDIKNHAFFRGVQWNMLHTQTPYFVPQIRRPDSVKYFDQSDSISDIDSSSSDSGTEPNLRYHETSTEGGVQLTKTPSEVKKSHQAEPQHIVPSQAVTLPGTQPAGNLNEEDKAPILAMQDSKMPPTDDTNTVDDAFHNLTAKNTKANKIIMNARKSDRTNPDPTKANKRPRDKILRDPTWANVALQMRKAGSFLGYEYRRGAKVNEVIEQAIEISREAASVPTIFRRFSVKEKRTSNMMSEVGRSQTGSVV